MAQFINPITTVFLNRDELATGAYDDFPFKYILEPDGTIMYESDMSAGRSVKSVESKIPGLATNKAIAAPKADIQHLAHGVKIPGEFFEQIRQFFLDVMDKGPSTYEAQAFVIWNETSREYRIIIPKQEVSAAAVRYDIGDLLSDDDVIIMDIHSHNDMGAFYSGTDDNDDKTNSWISGVFGKLSTRMEHVFRFNDGCGRNWPLKKEEIFTEVANRFATPSEWLDQVTLDAPRYSYAGYQPGKKSLYSGARRSGGTGYWADQRNQTKHADQFTGNGSMEDADEFELFNSMGGGLLNYFGDDPEEELKTDISEALVNHIESDIQLLLSEAGKYADSLYTEKNHDAWFEDLGLQTTYAEIISCIDDRIKEDAVLKASVSNIIDKLKEA